MLVENQNRIQREPLIEIDGFWVQRDGRRICEVEGLEVGRGTECVIEGANGAGKSTLLRCLAGLERDFDGKLSVALPLSERVYVHQAPFLFRGSVQSNIAYGLKARGRTDAAAVERWAECFQLSDLLPRSTRRLSGGERRRVALARAFVIEPALLLLDEPYAELDDCGCEQLEAALAACAELTTLIASPQVLAEKAGRVRYRLIPAGAGPSADLTIAERVARN